MMRFALGLVGFILAAVMFASLASSSQAADFELSGQVRDANGNAVSGVDVEILDSSQSVVATGATDAAGSYQVSVPEGIYSIRFVPPEDSGFGPVVVANVQIQGTVTLDVVLVPAGIVTLSGRLLDPLGNPVPGQYIDLIPATGGASQLQQTDSSGHYSFEIAPGNYQIGAQRGPGTGNVPQNYRMVPVTISVPESTVVDLTLPMKQVQVQVQDETGTPIENVRVSVSFSYQNSLPFAGGITQGYAYYDGNESPVTDAAGETSLWLLPGANPYIFTATPDAGMPFGAITISGYQVTTDQQLVIALQFIHPTPHTTAVFSPDPYASGNYPDPVTVSLQATAAPGQTVSETHVIVDDDGVDRVYTNPFEVSGDGAHTVEFWSIDDAGVYEASHTLEFTIQSVPPLAITTEPPLPNGTIGVPYEVTIEATGGIEPYTWSISGGILPPGLTIDSRSGVISGIPTTAGTFTFTVQVEDASATVITKQFSFAPPPSSGSAGDSYQQPVEVVDPGAGGDQATCTNYSIANGTELPPGLTLDPQTGVISGTPLDGGTYTFTVECVVEGGQTASREFSITILNPEPQITTLSPDSTLEGSEGFELTVQGQNFVQSSEVHWNGAPRPTTYVSATELRASIAASDVAQPGSVDITVVNPDPAGGTSNSVTFTIIANQAPVANAGGPYTISEGGSLALDASASSDPDDDALTYSWDVNGDGTFDDTTNEAPSLTWTDLQALGIDDGPATFNLVVQVGDGYVTVASDPVTLTLENSAPTATLSNTGPIEQSAEVGISFANASDTSTADTQAGLHYVFSCDGSDLSSADYAGAAPADSTTCLFAEAGDFTITGRVLDKDGGATDYQTVVTVLDVTPPTTTATLSGTEGNNGWWTSAVTVELRATDNPGGVGVTSISYRAVGATTIEETSIAGAAASIDLTNDGVTTLTFWSTDAAGNIENEQEITVSIDRTAPAITGAPDRDPNENGWYNSDVTVTFTCEDGTSGIASCTDPQTFGEGASQYGSGIATDLAGNSATTDVGPLNIDSTAPTIVGYIDPSANVNGWINVPVTVSFACDDTMSGIGSCTDPVLLSADGADQYVDGQAVDLAGNVATTTVGPISIDQTPPSCSDADFQELWAPNHKFQEVTINFYVDDATSGVASIVLVSITSNEEGIEDDIADWEFGTADFSGLLRSERLGNGDGRVYTFTYEITDYASVTTSCAGAIVQVPHDQGR